MAEPGTPPPPPTAWSEQTMGQRIVTAAWQAVAAHLARPPRPPADGAAEADPPDADLPAAIADRLR